MHWLVAEGGTGGINYLQFEELITEVREQYSN